MICRLTSCMRSPAGPIIVSPAPRSAARLDPAEPEHDALLELLHHPDRTASRDHAEHGKYREYDQDGSTIANSPSRAARARYGPGPVPNLRHARCRRRCLLTRTTAGGSPGARPQMTAVSSAEGR